MGKLEVAMGLETAHPEILERLNKRMTLTMFAERRDCCGKTRSICVLLFW